MKRKIYDKLIDWKNTSKGKTALMVEGARRIGKSYIVEKFGKNEYDSYIIIDFNNTSQQIKDLFVDYLDKLDVFFAYLSLYTSKKLYDRKSLIIFDEVQLYPTARAAIKYLVQDGRYDYIETGSLVSIKNNVKNIVIPSEEESIQMNPMDFEEFLWAMGEYSLMDLIQLQFNKLQPMGQQMHRKIMRLFRLYMVIGGMPQVVAAYVRTKDFKEVDRQKRVILNLYKNDISNYAKGLEAKVKLIFEKIPEELQRHEKKFKVSSLKKDARYRDYDTAFFWLEDAKVVNISYNCTEPNVGMKLTRDGNRLKCFMADTGLLISHAFDENGVVSPDLYNKLMLDKLEINQGMLIENIVSQMIVAAGHKLFFYTSYSQQNAEERMEIDFLISKTVVTSRHNVCPIEVKSGKNYSLNSLNKFKNKFSENIYKSFVLHTSDLKEDNGVIYLPLYMTPLI